MCYLHRSRTPRPRWLRAISFASLRDASPLLGRGGSQYGFCPSHPPLSPPQGGHSNNRTKRFPGCPGGTGWVPSREGCPAGLPLRDLSRGAGWVISGIHRSEPEPGNKGCRRTHTWIPSNYSRRSSFVLRNLNPQPGTNQYRIPKGKWLESPADPSNEINIFNNL